MITDPIADFITRIRNADLAKHKTVILPSTKMSLKILHILNGQKYIDSFIQYNVWEIKNLKKKNKKKVFLPKGSPAIINCSRGPARRFAYPVDRINGSRCIYPPYINTNSLNGALLVFLSYVQKNNCKKQPKIEKLKRISKSSNQIYWKFENMPRIQDGFGLAILSTCFGIMTDEQARERHVGGEVLLATTKRI